MSKGGFSWKRATGDSNMKRKISKATGIPTKKQGRKRKVARVMSGGCLTILLRAFVIAAIVVFLLAKMI